MNWIDEVKSGLEASELLLGTSQWVEEQSDDFRDITPEQRKALQHEARMLHIIAVALWRRSGSIAAAALMEEGYMQPEDFTPTSRATDKKVVMN